MKQKRPKPPVFPEVLLRGPEESPEREFRVTEEGVLMFRAIVRNEHGDDMQAGLLTSMRTWMPVDLDDYSYSEEARIGLRKWRKEVIQSRIDQTGFGWKSLKAMWRGYLRQQLEEEI